MVLSELSCVGTMETSFWASIGYLKESKGDEVPTLLQPSVVAFPEREAGVRSLSSQF